ncbi:nudix hydrolase 8 isoform X1 [Ditylenchus destructor]|uniref:Nudix hydrolase 8 isoform X1 n=1 Tax=Ditylenchus destructor TaxID=166010 RepID=A0AAD4QXW6_9BILA|nr:nudix hydrolase 8 isoform X1 [Ditylenchus destructor]
MLLSKSMILFTCLLLVVTNVFADLKQESYSYKCLTFNTKDLHTVDETDAKTDLDHILGHTRDYSNGGEVEGVWFKVTDGHRFWLPALHKKGFRLQMAIDSSLDIDEKMNDVIVMRKWLKNEKEFPDTMPLPAFTTIGIGAVIPTQTTPHHRIPGRTIRPNESFEDAIKEILIESMIHYSYLDEAEKTTVLQISHFPDSGDETRSKAHLSVYLKVTLHSGVADNAKVKWMQRSELEQKELGLSGSDKSAIHAAYSWAGDEELKALKGTEPNPLSHEANAIKAVTLPLTEISKTIPKTVDEGQAIGQAIAQYLEHDTKLKNGNIDVMWAKVHIDKWKWIEPLTKKAFRFQLAADESLKMNSLLKRENGEHQERDGPDGVILLKLHLGDHDKMPLPAFTTIGIGVVIVSEDGDKFLLEKDVDLTREGMDDVPLTHKFLGRAILPGESIQKAIERIVGEIGINYAADGVKFQGILRIFHFPKRSIAVRRKADMFIHCAVSLNGSVQPRIPKKAEWVDRENMSKVTLPGSTDNGALEALKTWLPKMEGKLSKESQLFAPGNKGSGNFVLYEEPQKSPPPEKLKRKNSQSESQDLEDPNLKEPKLKKVKQSGAQPTQDLDGPKRPMTPTK